MVSRRPFAGYWEYHIDGALFTSPPRTDHSGAACSTRSGELVGIGSLFVSNALGSDGPTLPGNMFVPVDLLRPILAELRGSGSSAASRRAWLGVNCVEQGGAACAWCASAGTARPKRPGCSRATASWPSTARAVSTLDALWTALWSGGPPEREVALEIERGERAQTLNVRTRRPQPPDSQEAQRRSGTARAPEPVSRAAVQAAAGVG